MSGDKTVIAISNNKGGVGKTTLAVMLAETALTRTKKTVNCIDLDEQKNFIDTMSILDKKKYAERLSLTSGFLFKGELNIIDCPPAMTTETIKAIQLADVVLMPFMGDMYSMLNISKVLNIGYAQGKSNKQMPLISVGVKKTSVWEEIKAFISEKGLLIGTEIPFNQLIPYNILTGQLWDYGISMNHRRIIYKLLDKILGGEYQ